MRTVLISLLVFVFSGSHAQTRNKVRNENYYHLVEGSDHSNAYRAEIQSDIDTSWYQWKVRGYRFGFDPGVTPMYTTINGIISTPYMVQVRGNENEKGMKRWGYHVFEGYARDDKSRITLLVNKHTELNRPVAEMYYYGTEYNHSNAAYNWFRIGSDVRQHSFLFGRDEAIFYGALRLTNALTLGRVGKDDVQSSAPPGDDETHYNESAKHVNYHALRNAEDGTMFFDKDNQIVVIKVDGKWMKLATEPLPAGVHYEFEE